MKVGFSLNRGGGGPTLFMKKLKQAFKNNGLAKCSYFFDPSVDVNLFANKGHQGLIHKPYFFRADGVTFDIELAQDEIRRRNDPLKIGVENAAGVIYQSEYCRRMYQNILHVEEPLTCIIFNGTDLEIFAVEGEDGRAKFGIRQDELVFLSSAKWRAHKRLKDTVAVYRIFRDLHKDRKCRLLIIGKHDECFPDDDIISLGQLPHSELPAWYRTANIYLFLSWLESCPNSVVEAMACGLPVVCSNRGGTGELVEFVNGGIVVPADKEFEYCPVELYNPPSPDYDLILDAIEKICDNHKHYSELINRKRLSIDYVAKQYIGFIEDVLS